MLKTWRLRMRKASARASANAACFRCCSTPVCVCTPVTHPGGAHVPRECRCSEWPLSLGDTWSCGCPMVAAFLGLNTSASRCFLHFKPAFFQKRETPGFDTLCHVSHTACGQCAGCLHPEPTSPRPPAFSFHPRERPTITGCSASPGRIAAP